MQPQPTPTSTTKMESFETTLKRCYARNHKSMEDFPVFAEQFEKTQLYLRDHPASIDQRVYYAYLSSEIGAAPFVVKQVVGLSLLPEVLPPFHLYSLKVALKKVGRDDIIAQYLPFQGEEVKTYEKDLPGLSCCQEAAVPLPKEHWWSRRKYEVKVTHPRPATFGEIEFLTAQLQQQTW